MSVSAARDGCQNWADVIRETFAATFESAPPLTDLTVERNGTGCKFTVRLRNAEIRTLSISNRDVERQGERAIRARVEGWVTQFRVVHRDLAEYKRSGVVCPLCGRVVRPYAENPAPEARALRWVSGPCASCGTRISMRSPDVWTL